MGSFVTKGTKTSTGGEVLEGHDDVKVAGQPATSIEQKASCASGRKECKGVGIIVPIGSNQVYLPNGKQAVLPGYQVMCNCPDNFILDPNNGVNIGNNVSFSSNVNAVQNARNAQTSHSPTANIIETQSAQSVSRDSLKVGDAYSSQITQSSVVLKQSDSPSMVEPDIDDTYIIFADQKTDIKTFAQEVYLTDSSEVIQHIIKVNPHLKRTFHFLVKGMPIVVSPWQTVHPDEADATSQVSDLAELFFTLSPEQQAWFSEHHEEFASVMLTSTAMPNSTLYEVNDGQVEESNFTNQMIASVGSGIAGMKTQADRLQKEFQRFENYSKYVGEATKGIKGDRLKSNPDYKQWRKQARSFQSEVQAISTQFGAPNYIKNIQANKVNNYLNVGKKQLYKAKDFSKAISGIEMTALYKKSMEFSKYLGRAAWVATIFGVRDNFIDIAKTCAQDEGFSEACMRAGVKNSASIGLNVLVGEGIGFLGTRFAPTTYGLSIIPMVGGLYYWGLYGGEASNYFGDGVEYAIFDLYGDTIELINGAQQ